MQICIERIGENASLMRFHAIVPDIRLSGEPESIPSTNYRFSCSVELWKLAAKFLVSSVKVIDTVGFLSFFKSFTRTTIKTPLKFLPLTWLQQTYVQLGKSDRI